MIEDELQGQALRFHEFVNAGDDGTPVCRAAYDPERAPTEPFPGVLASRKGMRSS